MTWLIPAVLTGIVTFTITNIDDVLVLAIFFAQSQSNPALKKRYVIIGQYLGFSVLVLASLLVFLTSLVIPLAWIGFTPWTLPSSSLFDGSGHLYSHRKWDRKLLCFLHP